MSCEIGLWINWGALELARNMSYQKEMKRSVKHRKNINGTESILSLTFSLCFIHKNKDPNKGEQIREKQKSTTLHENSITSVSGRLVGLLLTQSTGLYSYGR